MQNPRGGTHPPPARPPVTSHNSPVTAPMAESQPACLPQAGGTMPDRLDDFQNFRADLNEEILGCGHLGIKRFFALDHQAYEPARSAPRPRNSSAWWPAPFSAATIASLTTSYAAAKKAGSAKRS